MVAWGLRGQKILILTTLESLEKALLGTELYTLKITSTYQKVLKVLQLLLKNVEEILFGQIFLGTHTGQTVSKHVSVVNDLDLHQDPKLESNHHFFSLELSVSVILAACKLICISHLLNE